MKRFMVIGVMGLVLMATSALAVEFNVSGKWDYDTEYGAQTGSKGFFGLYDVDGSASLANWPAGTDSNLNFWFGRRGIVSGSDAVRNRSKMYFYPQIKINNAVRLWGSYKIGGAGTVNGGSNSVNTFTGLVTLTDSSYANNQSPGTESAMALGEWLMWAGAVRFPFGTMTVGKRPFSFGNGLIFNGAEVTTTEAAMLVVPYGPLTFTGAVYCKGLAPRYNPWALPSGATLPAGVDPAATHPFWGSTTPWGITSTPAGAAGTQAGNLAYYPYNRPWDASSVFEQYGGGVQYHSGSLETGVWAWWDPCLHFGPEFRRGIYTTREATRSMDQHNFWGVAYMKYSNCRFFLNADLGWYYQTINYSGPLTGNASPNNHPTYIESLPYMVETGAMAGPAKLSLFYMHKPGPDRRGGLSATTTSSTAALIDNQGYWVSPNQNNTSTGVTRPYSFLLGWTYGSGIGAIDANNHGYFNDASVVAARLDYAAASNLNVWGSALYAERANVSGWGFGCMSPRNSTGSGGDGVFYSDSQVQRTWKAYDGTRTAPAGAPNIPDPSLGYEFGVGMNWQLLNNYTWNIQSNYWMPGAWFKYACLDRGTAAWNVPVAGNHWGVNPGRDIDSVVSVYSNFVFDF